VYVCAGTRVSPQLLEQKEKLLDLIMHAGASGGEEVYMQSGMHVRRAVCLYLCSPIYLRLSLALSQCKEDVFRLGSINLDDLVLLFRSRKAKLRLALQCVDCGARLLGEIMWSTA
jgi:hypothetical protein